MKILFLTTILFSENCNGGEVASQCFIKSLSKSSDDITVVGYLRKGDSVKSESYRILIIDERYTETKKSKSSSIFWYFKSFIRGTAYSAEKYYSKPYILAVKQLLKEGEYDLVVLDHAQMGWLSDHIPDKYPIIAIAHNVEADMYQESSQHTHNRLLRWIYQRESRLIGANENQLAHRAQQVWTLTQNDAGHFSQKQGARNIKVFDLPPASTSMTKNISKSFSIGLLGSWSWKANHEALCWFLEHVYPHLPADLSIHVAGKGAEWLVDKYCNVHYRGVVPDAQEFLAQAKVVAIPTLSGGGIQIKTLDSIASGSLIVATPIALRGINNPPATVSIADAPEAFANQLVQAIRRSSTHPSSEAKNWYHNRQQKFQDSIQDAVSELLGERKTPKADRQHHLAKRL